MQGIYVKQTKAPSYAPTRKPIFDVPAPEILTGLVQNKKASSGEERLAKALNGRVDAYAFQYTVGAPPDMPGWKQLDFVIAVKGMIKTAEVDNPFTHRDKQIADKLHDAIALSELKKTFGDAVWPKVYRAIDIVDLADQKTANEWVIHNIT